MPLYAAIMLFLLVSLFILLSLAPMLVDGYEEEIKPGLIEEEKKPEHLRRRLAKLHLSGNE